LIKNFHKLHLLYRILDIPGYSSSGYPPRSGSKSELANYEKELSAKESNA